MAGDDERTEGEDLFEDLDKFFAPIQDVDWPESADAPTRGTPQQALEEVVDVRTGAAPSEEPIAEGGPHEGPEAEAPQGVGAEAPETPFAEIDEGDRAPMPADEEAVLPEPDEVEEPNEGKDAGVGAFLFGSEAEKGEGSIEGEVAPISTRYVDLPGPEDEGVEVAELIEEGPEVAEPVEPIEEAPDLEAVEAAADHFAESVRDEVTIEPEPADTGQTEEVAITALLGEEEAETFAEPEPSRTVRVGPEGFGGPSWQEPSAMEVGADQERAGAGRDIPTAFLTGVILAALAVGSLLIGPGAFAILAGLVVLFAQGEFYLAMQKRNHQPATALGLVSGALVLGAGYYRGENAMLAILALATIATFLWYMTVPAAHRRDVVSNVAITVLGIVYIPLLAAYALAVLKLPDGEGLTLSIIGLTFIYDTAAFGVGYFWGSRPLAPNISPKKSWEGAIGATLVVIAVAVGVIAPTVTLLDTVGRAVGLAVVVAIFAPLGDLAESLLKRDLDIKDMGGILPGHGGVMDRIDSVLFVAPAAFIYLRLILL